MPADDLSLLGDAELAREKKREALRRDRGEREAASDMHQLDCRERVTLIGLLRLAALVCVVVVCVGLLRGSDELVRDGLVGLTTACGALLYRVLQLRSS